MSENSDIYSLRSTLPTSNLVEKDSEPFNYSDLLKHPKWQRKRLEVMQRDGFKCQLCDDDESMLHVHHKSYEKGKRPWEYENKNFVTLCDCCHAVIEACKKGCGKDLSSYKGDQRKDKIARNLVDYEAGKTIFNTARGIIEKSNNKQVSMFDEIHL